MSQRARRRGRLAPFAALLLTACAEQAPLPLGPEASSPPPVRASASPAATFTVTTTADAGPGSLRQAILDANASAGLDLIAFAIPAASDPGCDAATGVCTIRPLHSLPMITDALIVDGYTQAGSSPNTNGPGLGTNAVLKIELDGSLSETDSNGLVIHANDCAVRGLVINRFARVTSPYWSGWGVVISGSASGIGTRNVIEGNFIGTDVTGTEARPNGGDGIAVLYHATGNVIGGNTAAARNLLSGNAKSGIIFGRGAHDNRVIGNFIGTDVTGSAALPNGLRGVFVTSGEFVVYGMVIGGTTPEERNVISGNGAAGISLDSSRDNIVQGNFIGTDVTGTKALGNGASAGVEISHSARNRIGGTAVGAGNVISGNGLGVHAFGSVGATYENVIQGNLIGTDATGTQPLGNTGGGIRLTAASTRALIGGTEPGAGNVISANGSAGIILDAPGPVGHRVQGNLIGTDLTGTQPLGNAVYGINAGGEDVLIGGTAEGAGNVISANKVGLVIGGAKAVVQGNYIGTDRTGTIAIGNTFGGLSVGSGVRVGGTSPGARNVISGNPGWGLVLNGSGIRVEGNLIGTDVTGEQPLGNWVGVAALQQSTDNVIGGITGGAGNLIAHNASFGVFVRGPFAKRNAIMGNSIHANGGLGIDLSEDPRWVGVHANDPGDTDTGANDYQNFPVITAARSTGTKTRVTGSLSSAPDRTYLLQFYANAERDPSGHGEGERFLGSASVTTDATGHVAFEVTLEAAAAQGEWITATATDPDGNTSEFSGALEAELGLEVTIDIKPGSWPNSINLNANGPAQIPVALLTTSDFDAGDADPETLTLGDEAGTDVPVSRRNNGSLMAGLEDVDRDGDLDLILHFDRAALIANGDLHAGTTQLCLTGATRAGVPLRGCDAVRVVP